MMMMNFQAYDDFETIFVQKKYFDSYFEKTATTTVNLLLMMIPGDFANTLRYCMAVTSCFFRMIRFWRFRAKN